MIGAGREGLLDLDAVHPLSGEPVHDVSPVVTAESLVRLGDADLEGRAGRRASDGVSDLLLQGGQRGAANEDPGFVVEPMKGDGVPEASGDDRVE